VAGGESLPFDQSALVPSGHAIECRITSEDPAHGFLPSTGRITMLEIPGGPGVRWDGGIAEGVEVSLFYDPLLGKLVVHGPDRETALNRMARALAELRVVGVETSTSFHRRVMAEPDFRAGDVTIRYLEEHEAVLAGEPDERTLQAAAVAAAMLEDEARSRRAAHRIGAAPAAAQPSRWRDTGWRPWGGS
jgi:acetyl-CoA carboxylase, biotin carboxylase subunit